MIHNVLLSFRKSFCFCPEEVDAQQMMYHIINQAYMPWNVKRSDCADRSALRMIIIIPLYRVRLIRWRLYSRARTPYYLIERNYRLAASLVESSYRFYLNESQTVNDNHSYTHPYMTVWKKREDAMKESTSNLMSRASRPDEEDHINRIWNWK